MIRKEDNCKGKEEYKYHVQGNLIKERIELEEEEWRETSYTYDEIGRRTAITSDYGTVRFDYIPTGYMNRITDALGNITRKIVDTRGNLLKLILPNQYQEEIDNGEGYHYIIMDIIRYLLLSIQ